MARIKKNDKVEVIAGKDKGRQGKVLRVFQDKDTALVERLNIVKRHTRGGGKIGKQGGIIDKEAPIRLSKLILVCPKCSKTSRIGTRVLDDGQRVRYCKKCDEQLDS
ncbi:MAG: 50S ribosomal protein L24 [Desulfomonile sp.]|jgi:large subunit ribosomal protein L24|nr:50S ribosomal protein L24 [Deltaproteobacteria bacterium]